MSTTAEAPPPEQPPAPQPDACPNCGAPLPPGQDWCLNCGAPARTRIARTPNWRLPVAIVAALVVLLGAAVAVAFVQLSDDSKDVGKTTSVASAPTTTTSTLPAATTPGVTPPATSTPTVPGATTPTTPGSATPTTPGATTTPTIPEATGGTNDAGTPHKPTPTPKPAATVATWPAGRTAYTAVLMSATSKSEADAKARSLAGRGVDVGVLHSNDYSSLEPGYWVVFSGHYPGLAPAQAAAQRLAGQGAPGAYGRLVKP